jgi:CRP-like cAMP-binding protein
MLLKVAKSVRCEPNTVLFRRGEPGDELFVVLSGQVDFFLEETKEDGSISIRVENEAGPGEAFGEIALFSGEARTLGARTRSAARLCVIQRDSLFQLMNEAGLAQAFVEVIAKRFAAHCRRQYAEQRRV